MTEARASLPPQGPREAPRVRVLSGRQRSSRAAGSKARIHTAAGLSRGRPGPHERRLAASDAARVGRRARARRAVSSRAMPCPGQWGTCPLLPPSLSPSLFLSLSSLLPPPTPQSATHLSLSAPLHIAHFRFLTHTEPHLAFPLRLVAPPPACTPPPPPPRAAHETHQGRASPTSYGSPCPASQNHGFGPLQDGALALALENGAGRQYAAGRPGQQIRPRTNHPVTQARAWPEPEYRQVSRLGPGRQDGTWQRLAAPGLRRSHTRLGCQPEPES